MQHERGPRKPKFALADPFFQSAVLSWRWGSIGYAGNEISSLFQTLIEAERAANNEELTNNQLDAILDQFPSFGEDLADLLHKTVAWCRYLRDLCNIPRSAQVMNKLLSCPLYVFSYRP